MLQKQLTNESWLFKESSETEWLKATVPGCVHTDLLQHGKISDPFYGENELNLQWIDKKDWEYQTTFRLNSDFLSQKHIELVLPGLDTYAEVYINGNHLLTTNNMFRKWVVDIKEYAEQENLLHVYFHSPINKGLSKLDELGYGLPAANDHSEDGGLEDKKVSVFSRKAPYHYGWDWGPRFVTSGIWKGVYLNGWSGIYIEDVFIEQTSVTKDLAELTIHLEIKSDQEQQKEIKIDTEDLTFIESVDLSTGLNQLHLNIELNNPRLWWSNGLGEQYLYTFTALFKDNQGDVISRKSVKTGLRSIKLKRIKDPDGKGESFYFELNGVPIFAKGANHIPNDSFPTEVTEERYTHEIISAKEANMNMLRVWGGGIYEYDAFYDLCDEHGILVWQDFMFGCSMYPGDRSFLENIAKEAEENIKRLRNHPSIALWCGNNEIDTAWAHYNKDMGWGWKVKYEEEVREKIWADYEIIFHDILPKAVEQYSNEIAYWPSSPLHDLSGTITQHSKSTTATKGDVHYWHVWHGRKPIEEYKNVIGRFMSEYGFQSFPELKTVRMYAKEKDLALESKVMLHHQKNGSGNRLIKEYLANYYKEPKDFKSFLYMSQVLQAYAIKTAIEAHRVNKPYCMGTLYWQMNDCWPVASWSGIDYYGRWKALHYAVKNSFRNILLTIDKKNETINFTTTSEKLEDLLGDLHILVMNTKGEIIEEYHKSIHIKKNCSDKVDSINKSELINFENECDFLIYGAIYINDQLVTDNQFYFTKVKEIKLSKPNIDMQKIQTSEGIEYELTSSVLAKSVWLNAENEGVFSDNFFDLIPNITKRVKFYHKDNLIGNQNESDPGKINIKSMVDFIEV